MVRVILVANIRLYSDSLAESLARREVEVVGSTGTVEAALALCRVHAPEVVLIDMAVHGGLDAVHVLARQNPQVHVLALGVPENAQDVIACAAAGVVGYVSRETSLHDLCEAILGAAKGELRCSARIADVLLADAGRKVVGLDHTSAKRPSLTCRELEVVRLINLGRSNKAIARKLDIRLSTVKNHVHNLLQKLGVSKRGEAAAHLRSMAGGSIAALTGSEDLVLRAAAPQELDPGVDLE